MAELRQRLESGAEGVRELTSGLKAPDLADLIELLDPSERVRLINTLGEAFDPEVFSEIDPGVRDQLSEDLPNEVLARIVTALDTDDAAYVIASLEKADQQDILAQMPSSDRARPI